MVRVTPPGRRRIEQQLSKASGVRRVGVDFATSRATVEYEPNTTGVKQLTDTVKEVGYGTAESAHADFIVDDSARPAGSGVQLEKYLARQRGVEATFKTGTMGVRVEYQPGATDVTVV